MPGWLKSRTVVLGTAALVLVVVAVIVFTYAFAAEPPAAGSGNPPEPRTDPVLTVEEASLAENGLNINVAGYVVIDGGQTVLASALAESYPPQPGGATLPVKGLKPDSLVGLSSTYGEAGTAQVTWSDFPLVLRGAVNAGFFEVSRTPSVEQESAQEGVRVRFSAVSEPISSGQQVWWAMDVTNTGSDPVLLTFSDSQRGDVILSQGDTDVYTWSAGMNFAQVVETVTLEPGRSLPVVLNGLLDVPPGEYGLTATVTALVGPPGQEAPLPSLTTVLTIH